MAEALRTAGKMTNTLLKRFIFVKNPNGMIGKQLIPISSPQIKFLLVQRPFGTYNYRIFEGKYHGTACLHVHVIYTRKLVYCAQRKKKQVYWSGFTPIHSLHLIRSISHRSCIVFSAPLVYFEGFLGRNCCGFFQAHGPKTMKSLNH